MADEYQDSYSPDTLQPSQSGPRPTTLLGPRVKLGLFMLLIVGALVFFATMAFRSATVYYMTVSELEQEGPTEEGRLVRVSGKLMDGTYQRAENGLDVSFKIQDEGGQVLPVAYSGEVGQLFFNDHSELILEGGYGHDGVFTTETLIVKCPSKYVNLQEEAAEKNDGEYVPAPEGDDEYQTEIYKSDGGL